MTRLFAHLAAAHVFFVSLACAVQITSLSENAPSVGRFQKYEAAFTVDTIYSNPFDLAIVEMNATITQPDATQITVPVFFYRRYDVVGSNPEQYQNVGPREWHFRFAPSQTGTYIYDIKIYEGGSLSLHLQDAGDFVCTESADSGFIRRHPSDPFTLKYDDGSPRQNIGHNVCWVSGGVSGWQHYLSAMNATDQNWTRIWMCPWNGWEGGMSIEWKKTAARTGYFHGVGQYSLQVAKRIDTVLEMAEDYGIAIQLVLQHHGQFSSDVNSNWDQNPYNIAFASTDGGFLNTPAEFFTNAEAIRLSKNKYRYIVARWGYSPAILAWELWNEVQYADAWHDDIDRPAVIAWHRQMSDYIRSVDPHAHLITTSSNETGFGPIWQQPSIDLIQVHSYSTPIIRPFEDVIYSLQTTYQKPVLMGEFGAGSINGLNCETIVESLPEPYQTQMNEALVLHNGIWSSLLCKSGSHLWWWDYYVYEHNDQFVPLASYASGEDFTGLHKAQKAVNIVETVFAVPRIWDWWAQSTQTVFHLSGNTFPGMEYLNKFLHGSWQPIRKSDPTFHLTMAESGSLVLHIARVADSGTNALRILVDSIQVLYSVYPNSSTNLDVTVPLEAGSHVVQVINAGNDWFEIPVYEFRPDGEYLLNSIGLSGTDRAYYWIYDVDSEYGQTANGIFADQPAFAKGLDDGTYEISFHPTRPGGGGGVQTTHAQSSGGVLTFTLPAFEKDIAVKVKPACIVGPSHLLSLAEDWLVETPGLPADLVTDGKVNLADFAALSAHWLDLCPPSW